MTPRGTKYNYFEVEDLAAAVLGLGDDAEETEIADGIADIFGVDMDTFEKIAVALVPFTVPAKTDLLNRDVHGYVKNGAFLLKVEDSQT